MRTREQEYSSTVHSEEKRAKDLLRTEGGGWNADCLGGPSWPLSKRGLNHWALAGTLSIGTPADLSLVAARIRNQRNLVSWHLGAHADAHAHTNSRTLLMIMRAVSPRMPVTAQKYRSLAC